MNLTLELLAQHKSISVETLNKFCVQQAHPGFTFQYFGVDGAEGCSRRRTGLKGEGNSFWLESDNRNISLYANSLRLLPIQEAVFIVEGESDCWKLYEVGLPAVGVPGGGMTQLLEQLRLPSTTCAYVVRENNLSVATFESGVAKYVSKAVDALRENNISSQIKIANLPSVYSDICDLLNSKAGLETLKQVMRDAENV